MALGWSGSNGGIGKAYKEFVIADVDTGISKYKALYERIPEEQKDTREFYQRVISGLKELRKQMYEGIESKL